MPNITQIPAPRVPIIDEKTGLMSREWYRFFVNIFSLTGNGSNTVSLEDVQVGPPPMDFGEVKSLFVAASPTTSVQYNNAGNFAGSSDFTYNVGTNTVTFGNLTGSALNMTIQPKAPTILENGGQLQFRGRDATAATRNGGLIDIRTGAGLGTGNGGGLTFTTGFGAVGGGISMDVGASTAGDGSGFTLTAGLGQAYGGNFSLTAGGASQINGFGGFFLMQGGNANNAGGVGGDFILTGGSGGTGAGSRNGTTIFASPVAPTYPLQVGDDGTDSTLQFFADQTNLDLVAQQTTATGSATRAAVIGTIANVGDTYDGYTIAQVVKALRNYGLLA
jgi:hypothetical protein